MIKLSNALDVSLDYLLKNDKNRVTGKVKDAELIDQFVQVDTLPPEVQRQAFDFIEFLKLRYRKIRPGKKIALNKIANEPFIRIWEDRKDMRDSSQSVRTTRESEWGVS